MTNICVTGEFPADLLDISDILRGAGMQEPKPSKHGNQRDIGVWHDQVMPAEAGSRTEPQPISSLGRQWEKLAREILNDNGKSKCWGWADTRSLWLLDFWLNFEPSLKFVLACTSPYQALADAMTSGNDDIAVPAFLDAWTLHHQELLRFYNRNPQRSLLVDASDCLEHPGALIARCVALWKAPLKKPDGEVSSQKESNSVAFYLAHQICQDYPGVISLQNELTATISPLREGADTTAIPLPETIISDFRALSDRSAEADTNRAALETLEAEVRKRELIQLQLDTVSGEKAGLVLQRDSLKQELESSKSTLDKQSKLAADLKESCEALERERDEQSKINQLRQEAEAGEKRIQSDALRTAQHRLQEIEQERALLLLQLDNVQAELVQQKEALAVEKEAMTGTLRTSQDKLKEIEQENDLLLLQLHQVQEELEHYFLQHQDLQKQKNSIETRWQRMLERNPDYCDFESIEVLDVKDDAAMAVTWRIKNLNAGGRLIPELEFKTVIEHEVAGFLFSRKPGTSGQLTRWPAMLDNQDEITIIPVGTGASVPQRAETVLDLATRDWDLVGKLPEMLASSLESSVGLKASHKNHAVALRKGLAKFNNILAQFPATLRYDYVRLKREQVNPDYEHLWLRFENLAFGKRRWATFEFRLSCANVGPNKFGNQPKLEFPEEFGQAMFDGWFIESYDDFGAKLELRFVLPESMDMAVWQRLSAIDRGLIFALTKRLPAILAELQRANTKIKRPWNDWKKLADSLSRVIGLRASQAAVSAPIPEVRAPIEAPLARVTQPKAPAKSKSSSKIPAPTPSRQVRKTKVSKSVRTAKAHKAK